MAIIIVSLYHNEKHLYDKFINGLYGDSGFKMANRGYILNRNNDSENSKYLKENTPSNFQILDRNYDVFRFDVARNDIYLFADNKESFIEDNSDIDMMMPSIDHFTTDKEWKSFAEHVFNDIKEDEGGSITTDEIDKYNIPFTTEIKDPIKVFKKKNFDYFVNFPVSEDYISTKMWNVIYSVNYKRPCKHFIHVHYIKDNPNQVNNLYRLGLNAMTIFELVDHLDEYDEWELIFMLEVPFFNLFQYLCFDTSNNLTNLLKYYFNVLLRFKEKVDSLEFGKHRDTVYRMLDCYLYGAYLKIMFNEKRKSEIDFTLYRKLIKLMEERRKDFLEKLMKINVFDK